jgi:hypothetical protein
VLGNPTEPQATASNRNPNRNQRSGNRTERERHLPIGTDGTTLSFPQSRLRLCVDTDLDSDFDLEWV